MNATNPKQLILLAELLRQKQRLLELYRQEPLLSYKPHRGEGRPLPDGSLPGGQDAFHRAGDKRVRGVVCGNRWGKSHCGAAEDAAWVIGERIWYPADDPARTLGLRKPPIRLLVLTTDWEVVHDVWTRDSGDRPGKIWKFLSNRISKVRRAGNGVINTITLNNGSEIVFETERAFLADPQSAESRDWDAIHVDEPVCEDMFKAHARGLMDRGGFVWFTLTAIREPWIVDYVKANGWYYEGSTYENPHLSKQAIEEFERMLTEDEKSCRLYGKPLHLAGLVYKMFNPEQHVLTEPPSGWPALDRPPKDALLYITIDPHPQVPTAVLFCAVCPGDRRRHYYMDIFSRGVVAEVAEQVRRLAAGYRVAKVRIDPAAFIRDPITGRSVANEFRRAGLIVLKARRNKSQGIMRVQQELLLNNIVFHATARRTIWEIQRYCWQDNGSNQPVDIDDHMMENLYRCELENPTWYPPSQGEPVEDLVIAGADLSPITFAEPLMLD